METISAVEQPPSGLSLLVGNYADTNLKDAFFDMVFINGSTEFANPKDVIAEAVRIGKKSGRLICFSCSQPLLADTFRLFFENRKEYQFNEDTIVLSANICDTWTHWAN